MLPAASWIVAVRTRVAPEVRLVVAPVRTICGGGAVDDGEGAERAGGQAGGGGFHRHRADECAGDRLGGDAGGGGRVAGAGDGAGAGRLARRRRRCVLSEVTVLPAASWIVAVSTRVAPEVRLVVEPVERDLGGGAVDDGEGAEGAGGQAGRGGFHGRPSRRGRR